MYFVIFGVLAESGEIEGPGFELPFLSYGKKSDSNFVSSLSSIPMIAEMSIESRMFGACYANCSPWPFALNLRGSSSASVSFLDYEYYKSPKIAWVSSRLLLLNKLALLPILLVFLISFAKCLISLVSIFSSMPSRETICSNFSFCNFWFFLITYSYSFDYCWIFFIVLPI